MAIGDENQHLPWFFCQSFAAAFIAKVFTAQYSVCMK